MLVINVQRKIAFDKNCNKINNIMDCDEQSASPKEDVTYV
jgi:hypothetical protein